MNNSYYQVLSFPIVKMWLIIPVVSYWWIITLIPRGTMVSIPLVSDWWIYKGTCRFLSLFTDRNNYNIIIILLSRVPLVSYRWITINNNTKGTRVRVPVVSYWRITNIIVIHQYEKTGTQVLEYLSTRVLHSSTWVPVFSYWWIAIIQQ